MGDGSAVVEAMVHRSRRLLLTVLAILAFAPLTLVVISGLVVGTALTLALLPALYAVWFEIPAKPRPA